MRAFTSIISMGVLTAGIVATLSGVWAAGTRYHQYDPAISTDANYCGPWDGIDNHSFDDASGVTYYRPAGKWFVINQGIPYGDRIGVWDSCTNKPSVDVSWSCNDNEGITSISKTSDVILVMGENKPTICSIDADQIIAGSPSTGQITYTYGNDENCGGQMAGSAGSGREGIAFVPDAALAGTCKLDGYILIPDQIGGYIYKYCLPLSGTTPTCLARYLKPGCHGSTEIAALEYGYDDHMLYIVSDMGNAVCVVDPTQLQDNYPILATIDFPATENAFEGFAIGDGTIALTSDKSDAQNSTNGFWVFEDLYCGDGHISSAETCDDGDKASGDGCSATCLIEDGSVRRTLK